MRPDTTDKRSGVALIMAVGFLAVLILMAIGFAVSMRVERLAARNFSDVVAARQHARTGLTRALADLNGRLSTDPLLTGTAQPGIFWQAGGPTNDLLQGGASNYIPAHLIRRVEATDPNWIDIRDNKNNRVGRYQYVAVDCSGLLDVNFDHSTNRFVGGVRTTLTNAMDIWMDSGLVDDVAAGKHGDLKDSRNYSMLPGGAWMRMESVAEIWRYLGSDTLGANLFASRPTNFFVYSRFPSGFEITPNSGQTTQALPIALSQTEWDYATSQAGLQNTTSILYRIRDRLQLAYQNAGLAGPQALEYAHNLAMSIGDYCDSDSVPCVLGATNSATEATPLLNEIVLEGEIVQIGQDVTVSVHPRVEVAFPFGGVTNSNPYTLVLDIQFRGATPAALNPTRAAQTYTYLPAGGGWRWMAPDGTFAVTPADGAAGALQKFTAAYTLGTSESIDLTQMKAYVLAQLYEGTVALGQRRLVDTAGKASTNLAERLAVDMSFLNSTKRSSGLGCNDPRHNAYPTQWKRVGVGGLPVTFGAGQGAFNGGGVAAWDSGTGENIKWMFIKNRPMSTPGEIGLLGIGPQWAWRTVDLLDNVGSQSPYVLPVLDMFTMTTNVVTRYGLINLNGMQPNVLACAFNKVSAEAYPGAGSDGNSSAPAQVDAANALQMAVAYMSSRTGMARNIAGVRAMGLSGSWGSGWSRADREAAVRNAANVLGTRDSTYTVLVSAQVLSDTGDPVAEQRALAVVWRDRIPQRDASGQLYNPTFVRFFRWMTD